MCTRTHRYSTPLCRGLKVPYLLCSSSGEPIALVAFALAFGPVRGPHAVDVCGRLRPNTGNRSGINSAGTTTYAGFHLCGARRTKEQPRVLLARSHVFPCPCQTHELLRSFWRTPCGVLPWPWKTCPCPAQPLCTPWALLDYQNKIPIGTTS